MKSTWFTGKPVQRILVSITLLLSMILIALFLSFWNLINHYIQKNAHENLTFVISRLSNDLDTCFTDLSQCGERLAVNPNIQQFLSAQTRYSNTQAVINDYYATASQSNFLSGAILFDMEGHFYRYGSASIFTNESCYALWEKVKLTKGFSDFTIDRTQYLCYIQNIYDFQSANMPQIGSIIVVMPTNSIVLLMNQYSIYENICFLLSEGETIILKTEQEDPVNWTGTIYTESASLSNKIYRITACIPKNSLFPYDQIFLFMAFGTACIFICIMSFYISKLNRAISIPIDTVIKDVSHITGSARGRLSLSDTRWLNPMITSFNELLSRVEEYSHRAFETQQRLYEAELSKQKMDLYLLRKQINAHFAYNSLNTIHALAAEHDDIDIQLIATGLAELIRYSYSPEEYINIFDEMQLIDQYVAIMNIRFQDKFIVEYNVDDRLCQYVILRQMIQPLVENALVHGLENKASDCKLIINGGIFQLDGDSPYLQISIIDNGIGMSQTVLEKCRKKLNEKNTDYSPDGIAIVNIHRRIQLYFGPQYGLKIQSVPNHGTTVSLTFPLKRDSTI
ncbi:histidine kinase [Catenibacillus scindens]|uniref:sensor histidine kinase n=1 Tax=Catenibacillus scindens TaxID=673271 RepID=UPI00320987A6